MNQAKAVAPKGATLHHNPPETTELSEHQYIMLARYCSPGKNTRKYQKVANFGKMKHVVAKLAMLSARLVYPLHKIFPFYVLNFNLTFQLHEKFPTILS